MGESWEGIEPAEEGALTCEGGNREGVSGGDITSQGRKSKKRQRGEEKGQEEADVSEISRLESACRTSSRSSLSSPVTTLTHTRLLPSHSRP